MSFYYFLLYLYTLVIITWFDTGNGPEENPKEEGESPHEARIFTFRELATATKNFRDETFIGQGGFGIVYKGMIGENQV